MTQHINMNYKHLRDYAISEFEKTGNTDSYFDADELLRFVFGFDRGALVVRGNERPDRDIANRFLELVKLRKTGTPLQYILGEWDFYNLSFKVGEGVLIPRPETELLVDGALDCLKSGMKDPNDVEPPIVFDLCAGTGCVGISIAKNFPGARVYEFEKSDLAFSYLKQNIEYNNAYNVIPVFADVLYKPFYLLPGDTSNIQHGLKADIIVSNPPYICFDELDSLQAEVLHEPVMALNGGNDGLEFYRAIANLWLPSLQSRLKSGGLLLVECGENQAEEIEKIFSICGRTTYKIRDFAGIYRAVGLKI